MRSINRKVGVFLQQLCMAECQLKVKITISMHDLLIYMVFKSFYNISKPNYFRFKVGVACGNQSRWLNKLFYMRNYATRILTICYYAIFTMLSSVISSNHNYKTLTFFAAYRIYIYIIYIYIYVRKKFQIVDCRFKT